MLSCPAAANTARALSGQRWCGHRSMDRAVLAAAPGWNLRSQAHPHMALQAEHYSAGAAAAAAAAAAPGLRQPFGKQQQQQQQQQPMPSGAAASASDSDTDSSGPVRVPLKLVVADAVKRWFNETLSEARRGDVKQQALLAQMYAEGYGCARDPEQARVWAERARLRGYQMHGVYCEL